MSRDLAAPLQALLATQPFEVNMLFYHLYDPKLRETFIKQRGRQQTQTIPKTGNASANIVIGTSQGCWTLSSAVGCIDRNRHLKKRSH